MGNLQAWNAFAELLGMLSSFFLLLPVIALNQHLREIRSSETALKQSTTDLFKAIAKEAEPTLTDARIPEWSNRDQRMLIGGIVTFGISCVIKFVVILNTPAMPTAPAGITSAAPAPVTTATATAR